MQKPKAKHTGKAFNRLLICLFVILTLAFLLLMLLNRSFFEWTFARHQNVLSWYIRPLIILPLCYFSYRQSGLGIIITAFVGLTSMFWFPVPQQIDERVIGFLAMEKAYLTSGWTFNKALLSSLVPLTLYLLCLSFWKRSYKLGIGMIILIAILKTLWSVTAGGEVGTSVIAPAMLGLLVCVGIILGFLRYKGKH